MKRLLLLVGGALVCSPALAEVQAVVGSPLGTLQISSNDVGEVTDEGNGTLRWTGTASRPDLGWALDWDFQVNGDPFITGVAGFTNMLATTSNFTFNLSTNSTETIAAPVVNGASAITVLDTNSNTASMAALAGDSIYDAFIVGTSQQQLFADPFSLSAPADGVDLDGTSWGPQASIGGINNGDIFGINHGFSLTAGDQATINSSFFINVPEPGTLVLLVLGGVFAARRR